MAQSSRSSDVPERRHSVVELKFPIRIGSESIERIYVKVPRGAEFGLIPAPVPGVRQFTADYHPFAARLCGLSIAEFELLEAEDYAVVMEAVDRFQHEVPPTGASASPGSRES